MDIQLTPDDTLPENTLSVAEDCDDDLLTAMQQSRFDVVVDDRQSGAEIRVSPAMLEQIMQWTALSRVSRRDG